MSNAQLDEIIRLTDELEALQSQISTLQETIDTQKSELKAVRKEWRADIDRNHDLKEEISTLQEKVRPLEEFAHHAIKLECWNYEVDGGDLQEKAEKLGLIEPHILIEGEEDIYGDGDFEAGDKIYVFSELLKG